MKLTVNQLINWLKEQTPVEHRDTAFVHICDGDFGSELSIHLKDLNITHESIDLNSQEGIK